MSPADSSSGSGNVIAGSALDGGRKEEGGIGKRGDKQCAMSNATKSSVLLAACAQFWFLAAVFALINVSHLQTFPLLCTRAVPGCGEPLPMKDPQGRVGIPLFLGKASNQGFVLLGFSVSGRGSTRYQPQAPPGKGLCIAVLASHA